jgi:hypothetical protein
MDQPSTSGSPRMSRETRGRVLFFAGTMVMAALVSFVVSNSVVSSNPGRTASELAAVAANESATTTTTRPPTTTTPAGSSGPSVGYDGPAICSPTTDAAISGGPPTALERAAREVSSGTIEGEPWSLWSAKGQSGASALEDGGLVLAGREYGLCPGYPNPSETEMIDTGGDAVIYGVVNYAGLAKVMIGTGSQGFTMDETLPSPHVAVVNGVSFYIGTLPKSACAYSYLVIDTTSPSASAEHNIGFGETGAGQGYSITNNPGNTGACTTGKLDPLSFSQGVWDMSPGQFSR